MKLEAFKDITTREQLDGTIEVLEAVSDEHGGSVYEMLKIEDATYKDLTYQCSIEKGGFLHTHFFRYLGESGHYGICRMRAGV